MIQDHSIVYHALAYARRAHMGQHYQNGNYYEKHITPVVDMLRMMGVNDPAVLAIGALHDVVEDCGVDLEEIRAIFGDRIAEGVDAISRRKIIHPELGVVDKESEESYLNRVANNLDARIAKHADMCHNLLMSQGEYSPPEKRGKWGKYINAIVSLILMGTHNVPAERILVTTGIKASDEELRRAIDNDLFDEEYDRQTGVARNPLKA